MHDAADAFARLDEAVAVSAPGMATFLMLRSAQAIVAVPERPLGQPSGLPRDGKTVFALLLGRWYAESSQEFIADDPTLRRTAIALDATSTKLRDGRAFTLALLHEAVGAQEYLEHPVPAAFEGTLRRADRESWPALYLAAELLAGECGSATGLATAIARAVAPVAGPPPAGNASAGAWVVARAAGDVPSALLALAAEARATRRLVADYGAATEGVAARVREIGRGRESALSLLDLLGSSPAVTVAGAAATLGVTVPTAGAAVERLLGLHCLREITGRGRDRVFVYEPAIALAGSSVS